MKSKALILSVVTLLTMFALAGCQQGETAGTDTTGTTTTTDTTGTTDSSDTTGTTDSSSTASGDVKEVATPEGVENLQNVDLGTTKSSTYSVKKDAKTACEDQVKLITDAGYKASEATPSAVESMGTWSQIFEGGKLMVTLTCTADPTNADMTMVSMAQTENMMAQ